MDEGRRERRLSSEGEESVGLPFLVGVAISHDRKRQRLANSDW
ncbi:MAG: hypothetical protein RRB24_05985 [Armatimonadota bacterium]|nr:hypothetical protein [Armatimonadota bacterium]